MAITKQDIENVSLGTIGEGYDPEEVDLLLERIAEEVDSFNRALIEAAARVEAAEARARAAEHQAAKSAQMAHAAQNSQQNTASEHQIAQALIAAQKSADELRETAKQETESTYRDAEKRARDIVRDALAEKQRILDEVDRLRESTETFRSEYMSVLSRFTSEAQKVMPKLEELAPDFTAEKKATAEAIQVVKEGDAAFEAPEQNAASSIFEFDLEEFEVSPQAADYTKTQNTSYGAQSPASQSAQPAFDLDDDLDIDIEEID